MPLELHVKELSSHANFKQSVPNHANLFYPLAKNAPSIATFDKVFMEVKQVPSIVNFSGSTSGEIMNVTSI